MNKVVDEIRESLKPHHVEGFTAMCFPMPTLRQTERVMAEVERLDADLLSAQETITHRDCQIKALKQCIEERDKRLALLEQLAEQLLKEHQEMKHFTAGFGPKKECVCPWCEQGREAFRLK